MISDIRSFQLSQYHIFSVVILLLKWLFSPKFSTRTLDTATRTAPPGLSGLRGDSGHPESQKHWQAAPSQGPPLTSETPSAHCDAGATEQCPEQPGPPVLLLLSGYSLPGRHEHLLPKKCEQSWNRAIWRPVS